MNIIMKWYCTNIEQDTIANEYFRKVLYTGKHMQLVLMSLEPWEDIWEEIHEGNDQFFRWESWQWLCIIDENRYEISDGFVVVIPSGTKHNIINTSDTQDLKMYTIYSPPHHQDGIIRETKKEAEDNEADFDGRTTE